MLKDESILLIEPFREALIRQIRQRMSYIVSIPTSVPRVLICRWWWGIHTSRTRKIRLWCNEM